MWVCAAPATQSAAASRATKPRPSAPPSAICATPATQNEGGCNSVPRGLYVRVCVCVWCVCVSVSEVSGVWVKLLYVRVCVKLWYVKFVCVKLLYVRDGMWQSCVCGVCVELWYVKFVCVKLLYVRDGMWQSCVCECVWSYCMWSLCVCEGIVCERWYVTKLCVCVSVREVIVFKFVCVKVLYVKFVCVKLWYVTGGRRRRRRRSPGYRIKNKNPTQSCGEKICFIISYYIFFWNTSSTAQGGGGSFKNRKPIGELGCCESGMAERIHWWTEMCLRSPLFLSLSLTTDLTTYLPTYLSIYLSVCLPVYLWCSVIQSNVV